MAKKFSKEKMMQRIQDEGRMDLLDDRCRELMDKIDGLPVEKNRFKALVYDELEYDVWLAEEKIWVPVNIIDCIEE